MPNIVLPSNAANGDIFPVSGSRRLQFQGGVWKIYVNAPEPTSNQAYPFKPPLVSDTPPALPNNNPFWINTVENALYFEKVVGTTYTWEKSYVLPSLLPVYSEDAPAFPCTNPFWIKTSTGALYFQRTVGEITSWVLTDTPQTIVVTSDTAPALPNATPFWFQGTTGVLYYQKTISGTTTWQATNAVDRIDFKVTTTTGAGDASSAQVFKIDNSAATTKTINITNLPAGRAMMIAIKIAGAVGTIAYTNTIAWDGGSVPAMGTTFTTLALFWDGTALTGNVGQKA